MKAVEVFLGEVLPFLQVCQVPFLLLTCHSLPPENFAEYAYTMQVTAPGNVYSYGVILLEILTTRLPVDEGFGEDVDLVKWVHSAPTRGETPEQILDARLSTVSFTWRREMLAALKVALLCTDSVPAKRPKMKKVVEMLQEIKQN